MSIMLLIIVGMIFGYLDGTLLRRAVALRIVMELIDGGCAAQPRLWQMVTKDNRCSTTGTGWASLVTSWSMVCKPIQL